MASRSAESPSSSGTYVSPSYAPNDPSFSPTTPSPTSIARLNTILRTAPRVRPPVARSGSSSGKDFNQVLHILDNLHFSGIDVKRSYLHRLWARGVNYYVVRVLLDLRDGYLTFGDAFEKIRRRAVLEEVVHKKTTKRDHATFLHLHVVCRELMPPDWSSLTSVTDQAESDATDQEEDH
jgi:hypothetical protein